MISPRGQAMAVWIAFFTSIDLILLALRFYAKKIQRRALRVDDYLIVLATVSMLVLDGCTAWAIYNGLGAHIETLTRDQIVIQLKLVASSWWTWTISTVCCKLAVLFLYLDLFHVARIKIAFYCFIGLTAAYALAFIPFFMSQCSPISAAWAPELLPTNCRSTTKQELASVSVNIFLDLSIVLLPAPLVWNLRMPLKKKMALTGIFGLGFCIVGIMLWRLVKTIQPQSPDFTYDLYILALQSLLELWIGIIAANIPTLGPLFHRVVYPKVKSYFSSRNSGNAAPRGNMIHTFGSSPVKKVRRDEFGLLSDDLDGSVELVTTTPGDKAIRRERDFEVTVQDGLEPTSRV